MYNDLCSGAKKDESNNPTTITSIGTGDTTTNQVTSKSMTTGFVQYTSIALSKRKRRELIPERPNYRSVFVR
jgi:hypothetical protein